MYPYSCAYDTRYGEWGKHFASQFNGRKQARKPRSCTSCAMQQKNCWCSSIHIQVSFNWHPWRKNVAGPYYKVSDCHPSQSLWSFSWSGVHTIWSLIFASRPNFSRPIPFLQQGINILARIKTSNFVHLHSIVQHSKVCKKNRFQIKFRPVGQRFYIFSLRPFSIGRPKVTS